MADNSKDEATLADLTKRVLAMPPKPHTPKTEKRPKDDDTKKRTKP